MSLFEAKGEFSFIFLRVFLQLLIVIKKNVISNQGARIQLVITDKIKNLKKVKMNTIKK